MPCGAQETQNPPREVRSIHTGNLSGAVRVSRVEADDIVLRTKSGISKIYFVELPTEVQQRFGYDAAKIAERAIELTTTTGASSLMHTQD